MRTFLAILLALSLSDVCEAQYTSSYNKIWAFGYKAGLDFTSGAPVPITTGMAPTVLAEGCASVCDSAGHLLFYTNGTDVFNRNHVVMPSGTAVAPFSTLSTTQSAVILPLIDSPNKYYLFSLQQGTVGDTSWSKLVFCVVNMSLNGGYGDVIASTKGTPVADSLCEKMMAIMGNDHNIWLIVHKKDQAQFLAYEITSAGVSTTPVTSDIGTFTGQWGYSVGVIKASHNRRRIVSNTVRQTSITHKYGTELYDFDLATGILSNCLVLDTLSGHYGAEFSPDNSKLYTDERVASDTMRIVQYNIGLTDTNAIRASKTQVAVIPRIGFCDLKLGPDKKIYFISTDTFTGRNYSRYMDCISAPNQPAASCGYMYRAITMLPGTGMQLGLPNTYVAEDTFNVTVNTLAQESVPNIDIYPNPANAMLTVSSPTKITTISVFTAWGQEVYRREPDCDVVQIDISGLQPNLYFIKINGMAVKKIMKL